MDLCKRSHLELKIWLNFCSCSKFTVKRLAFRATRFWKSSSIALTKFGDVSPLTDHYQSQDSRCASIKIVMVDSNNNNEILKILIDKLRIDVLKFMLYTI